jgi:hypothetical protein
MKSTLAVLLALAATAALAGPAEAEFGLEDLGVIFTRDAEGGIAFEAGTHPFALSFNVAVKTTEKETGGKKVEVPDEEARDVLSEFPPGFVANPTATARCSAAEFANSNESSCPRSSALGIFDLTFGFGEPGLLHVPVYNLDPPPGKAIRLGFRALGVPVVVDGGIEPHPPYNAFGNSEGIAQGGFFYRGNLRLWGNPASPAHDAERGECGASEDPDDRCPVSIPEKPFLLLPRSCTGTLHTQIMADSWQHPGLWHEYLPATEGMSACSRLPFGPTIDSKLSTTEAESPTGLAFDLDVSDPGLPNPDGVAASDIKKVVTTLPEGVTANPSQAEGLVGCSEADLARESADSEPGEGCPQASKIGTVEVETPLLEGELLTGDLYVATPYENPFGTLIALYMTIKDPELGINIVTEGKVEPDPVSGQLVATFDNLPQAPFSHFRLRFRSGGRSPLVSPPACGAYTTVAQMTPWADPSSTYTTTSSFQIASGPGGAPCPAASARPFEPGFGAGSLNNNSGAYSPFSMRLTRRDGDQDLTRFDATLPPGVVARLASTSRCTDSQIATAKAKSGRDERRNPSCPQGSLIGHIEAGAGVGSQLTYVPGSLYLAGPFGGAPLSAVGIVPAVAGPFDVGTVVVRQALKIDPRTAEVTADGAHSDPIPHILAGIPLRVRDIQVAVDKPSFTLNPTSCDPFATKASIWGGGQNAFSTIDDSPVPREARYQASGCQSLAFKPHLSLRLEGGTRRGAHPALRGLLRTRDGDANLSQATIRLPRSAFLDQGHIRTICTRVQFAANGGNGAGCPAAAIYGHATAYTPLLSEPLEGPVYLRSSSHNLPDLVAALHGLVDVEAVARIDSKNGGIRATFSDIPDVPASRVIVNMQGAKKGLIVNSTNLCARAHRASVLLDAHNSKRISLRPEMRTKCGG